MIAGKTLIQRVWERCQLCKKLDGVVIATDDVRIVDAAEAFGAKVVMTATDHPTGTDRLAEAVTHFPKASHVVNVQGDEPLIDPALIDELADALLDDANLEMATAANALTDEALINDSNVVKVVMAVNGDALYFSRSAIPYLRDGGQAVTIFRHKGIYAYRRDFLEQFVQWPPTVLEQAESLEQLRALENGAKIRVIVTQDASGGVDTLEQAEEMAALLAQGQK